MKRFISILAINLAAVGSAFAQTYGSGSYNSQKYQDSAAAPGLPATGHIHFGPVTLPVTDPQFHSIVTGVGLLAIAVILLILVRVRRKRTT